MGTLRKLSFTKVMKQPPMTWLDLQVSWVGHVYNHSKRVTFSLTIPKRSQTRRIARHFLKEFESWIFSSTLLLSCLQKKNTCIPTTHLVSAKGATPWKINMEHNHGGLVQIIFLSKLVIWRFQPLIFRGVAISLNLFHDPGTPTLPGMFFLAF